MLNRRSSIFSIAFALLFVSYFAWFLPKTEFDYQMENFFPMDDPDLEYYQTFSKKFGQDNDYILIALQDSSGIFNSKFIDQSKKLVTELSALKEVKRVQSFTNMKKLVKSPMGYIELPYLHPQSDDLLQQDSIRIANDSFIRQIFFSKDLRSTKIIIIHDRFVTIEKSDEFIDVINGVLSKYDFDTKNKAGKILAQKAFLSALERDFSSFLVMATALVLIMLIIFIRHPILIITALGISGLSLVATLGLMALTGKKIDALSTLIPSILLVVSMSDIIHLYSQARIEIKKQPDFKIAINTAIRKVGWATLLTSLTTAVGFITLITINVKPVIGLGIYSALGIVLAFLITYLIFPQVLMLVQPRFKARSNQPFIRILANLLHLIFRKKITVLLSASAFLVLVIVGVTQLKVDARLIDDLPNGDSVKEDFLFFDENFSGSKPFVMSVWLADSSQSIYSKEVITEMEKIECLSDTVLQAGSLISPVTYVKLIHQSLNGGRKDFYRLPENERQWKRVFKEINRLKPESKFMKVSDHNLAQITGFLPDHGSLNFKQKKIRFEKLMAQHVDSNLLNYRITGTSTLIDKSHEVLSYNLIKGLFFALLIVGIISGIMFRSWRMVFITLIPNLFPILSVAAIMGYMHIPINLSSSVIFAISFGIIVDDTIHFLSKLKMEKSRGLSTLYAVKRTMYSTGEPIIITTIILTSGFVVFCFSSFNASFYIGLFVSISFLVALLADLILLPTLILMFFPNQNKKSLKE